MPDVINSEWGEQIKLHNLHLEGPFEGCRITKLIMHVAPSEHASMRIEAKLNCLRPRNGFTGNWMVYL